MDTSMHSWAIDRPLTSPFARPKGWRGRLAGRFMLWTNHQDDLIDILDVRPGHRVLEVGYGPGGLVRLLLNRTAAASVVGVDPSPAMRDQAKRVNKKADLRLGTAEQTGLDDASVDRVVSVNTVAIWPDLEAGIAELHRVVRPGGTVTLAWHGGTNPSRIARGLRLPAEKLDRIEGALRERFGQVRRVQLAGLDVFTAARPA
jgi:SAM-dependent methyltransferase